MFGELRYASGMGFSLEEGLLHLRSLKSIFKFEFGDGRAQNAPWAQFAGCRRHKTENPGRKILTEALETVFGGLRCASGMGIKP